MSGTLLANWTRFLHIEHWNKQTDNNSSSIHLTSVCVDVRNVLTNIHPKDWSTNLSHVDLLIWENLSLNTNTKEQTDKLICSCVAFQGKDKIVWTHCLAMEYVALMETSSQSSADRSTRELANSSNVSIARTAGTLWSRAFSTCSHIPLLLGSLYFCSWLIQLNSSYKYNG